MRENLIPEVFDLVDGRDICANRYFNNLDDRRRDEIHSMRRELVRARRNGQKLWVCALCQGPVYIAGGLGRTKRRSHFRHFVDSPRCPYQTRGKLDKETIRRIKYNGAKESSLHHWMKESLASLLQDDLKVADLAVEKTFFHQDGGRNWRRPDIACSWQGIRIILEIQISSDFVDVIVGREDFYRGQGVFILWVFNKFDTEKFTVRDIYVGSQKNCFIFNDRTLALSLDRGALTFECHYEEPVVANGEIIDEWHEIDVTLEDLTFDQDRMQGFWFDYELAEKKHLQEKLLVQMEEYWCGQREALEVESRAPWDKHFEEEIAELFGVDPGWARYDVVKILSALYSLQKGQVFNYDLNLFGLVDTMLTHRKPFTFVVLGAIHVFGHWEAFKDRPAFTRKLDMYGVAKRKRDPTYRREKRFDSLFVAIFPELGGWQKTETGSFVLIR